MAFSHGSPVPAARPYCYAHRTYPGENPNVNWYRSAIDEKPRARLNQSMTRCQSCDGILAKSEKVCYSCGSAVPGAGKSKGISGPALAALVFIASLAAYSFLWGRAL